MKRTIGIISTLAILITLAGIFFYQRGSKRSHIAVRNSDKIIQRIISLSPNITEILYALGLGEKVVGVTRFCNYPAEAKSKPRIGGYLDPNYEAILSLKPDVVLVLPEFRQIKSFLAELKINYLEVNNKTIADILASIRYLGRELGAGEKAEQIVAQLQEKLNVINDRTRTLARPKVMICIERSLGTGRIENVYIAGRNTFYDELIQYAGGKNAFDNDKIAYPVLSAEGIIHLNPDFIFDLVPQIDQTGLTESMLVKEWDSLGHLDAVQQNHVYVITSDYAVIPGPRFILFLEKLARTIHPEINAR